MTRIIEAEVLALRYQVALLDKDTLDYPQWETGREKYVFNLKGVAVNLGTERYVTIAVYADSFEEKECGEFLGEAEIEVGNKGLIVGNEEACDTYEIDLPRGKYRVGVYLTETQNSAKVIFVIVGK
jgi:hypothetical protein